MGRAVRVALVFVTLAWGLPALADPTCRFHEEADNSAPASKDSLTLLAVDPPEGAELRKDMVVAVDVQFQIANFQPNTYFIVALFPTAGFGSMSPGKPGDVPMLQHPSGKVRLCVPLQEIYDHPAVVWPLSMRAQILKSTGDLRSNSTAFTRQVKFKSPDAPTKQKTFPDEYYDALKHTNSYFDNRAVLYKLCIARFPAMQPALTKAYRAWEGRHRADMDLAAELQFAQYKALTNGRAVHAAGIGDAITAASRQHYEGLPAAALQRECEKKLAEFTDPDDTTGIVIGDEMAILRKYSGMNTESGT